MLRQIKRILIAGVVAIAAAQATQAQVLERSLAGVWEVKSTPRNCETGVPNLAAAFQAIYTFHRDGTMISWYSSGTPSTGHGLWRRELGWSDYSFKLVRILRSATTPPVFSGKQEIGGTLVLSESGDEFTSDDYMIVYPLDGVPTTPSCISSVGTRFTME